MSVGSEEKVPVPAEQGAARLPRRYPWTARITSPNGIGRFAPGALVRVAGMDGQQRYLISDRTRKPEPHPRQEQYVPADPASLDEALSWALDNQVMAVPSVRENILWQDSSPWLSLRAVTKNPVTAKKLVEGGPEVTVDAGAQVNIEEWKDGRYLGHVAIGEDFAAVDLAGDDLVNLDESVPWPSPSRPVGLMCHQLAPYAACKSGLRSERDFYRATLTSMKNIETNDFWSAFCDAEFTGEAIKINQVKPEQFSRGDLVVFDKYNGFAHVAIATGRTADNGSPSLYSLWNNKKHTPVVDNIASIYAHSLSMDADHPLTQVRTATPAWYLRG